MVVWNDLEYWYSSAANSLFGGERHVGASWFQADFGSLIFLRKEMAALASPVPMRFNGRTFLREGRAVRSKPAVHELWTGFDRNLFGGF